MKHQSARNFLLPANPEDNWSNYSSVVLVEHHSRRPKRVLEISWKLVEIRAAVKDFLPDGVDKFTFIVLTCYSLANNICINTLIASKEANLQRTLL